MAKKASMAIAGFAALFTLLLFTACDMSVNQPLRPFMEPFISVQPQSHSYIIGDADHGYPGTPPALSVEIWDWAESDGELTYQWYAFDDIADYYENGEGTAIAGASGPVAFDANNTATVAYTPASLNTEPGSRNYFYLRVTNFNDKVLGSKTQGDILSEIAVISFNSANAALIPIITRQPASNTYRFGESLRALEVRAFIPNDQDLPENGKAFLTYQWYTNSTQSLAGGTPIEDAVQTAFLPDPRTLAMGDNFFYVIVTNNIMNDETQASIPAVITMLAGERASEPRIVQQPKDMHVFIGGEMGALAVQAESPDSGSLSYQWYSNTQASVAGGSPQAVSGATGSSFTPATGTSEGSVTYYFVEVTNTNNNVSGEKTAKVNSKPVKVAIASTDTPAAGVTVDIRDPSVDANRFNYVRGYGGMDTAWANFPETTAADTEFMYNPDTGLGYNILRIMIIPKSTNIEASMKWLVSGNPDLDEGGGFREDFYENVKIANKHGGYVLASPWSPPKEWKSNNSINGGGHLLYQYRKQYAQYLRSFARHMYDMGAPVYAVSIQNEPNYVAGYDGCEWSQDEMRDFFLEVGHFTDGVPGYGGGMEQPVVLTMNGESANTPSINSSALADPASNAVIDLLARHAYGSQNENLWNYANRNGKEVWMTEHNINSASATAYPNDYTWNYVWRFMNDIDLVMRLNNENAFVWWASKRFYSMQSDGQNSAPGGTNGNGGNRDNPAPALPRGWGLSHYAKYTIGKTRIAVDVSGTAVSKGSDNNVAIVASGAGANVNNANNPFSMDDLSAKITAYVSEDGSEISMVMWTPTQVNGANGLNIGPMQINLPSGFTAGGVMAVKSTSAATNDIMQPEEVVLSADRKSAFVTLNDGQIMSIRFTKE